MATIEETLDKAIEVAVKRATAAAKTAILATHPVGSLYLTVGSENPSTVLGGGTWTKVGTGRCLWGADSSHAAGSEISAGLPNITGSTILSWGDASGGGVIMEDVSGGYSGALYPSKNTSRSSFYTKASSTSGATKHLNQLNVDASRSSSLYGASTTVQPPALVVNIWKRTA